ncbi:tetratricopeptide repeat protein [Spirosoma utsteinense]|uniref:Tetratricopeptide (TPR) repeat protein n=1 Tax=Spirosoma utsteinense TaxID=2585773 RepID=A0ABR6W3D9_9BACT|nr:tetratricopeptide repeat protein [Spirosoma utsteinense]MBC3790255.1 tetratricopeptide (TPR) repeat protein [Spirosoma utsteinense]
MVIIVLSLNNLLYKMLIRLKVIFVLGWVLSAGLVQGQTGTSGAASTLAEEYYKAGEFEKAANEYGKLLKSEVTWARLSRYVVSLQKINKADEAVKYLRRQQRGDEPNRPFYELLTGQLASQQGDTVQAKNQYTAAIQSSKSSVVRLEKIAAAFSEAGESRWAIRALETARETAKDRSSYSEELMALYRATGQTEKAIDEIILTSKQTDKKETVLAALQGYINTKNEPLVEKALYAKIQQEPNELAYNELLTWYFVQKQKFSRALMQEKATDKRMKLSGSRVYDLGMLAMNNKEYKTAADAFDYITTTYPQGQLYPFARRLVINAREEQVKNTYPVDKIEIRKLISDYQKMLQEIGTNSKTLEALRSTANLYGNYLDSKDTALTVLDLAIDLGKNDRNFVDKCKLDKGDMYLLKGEPWESTLLYSQVEKSQKEELLGYEAKLKNAKLQYYKGSFTVAKEILDVLKLATSREIANDAEQLSLLIVDNTGMDSTEAAMRHYADVELMLFQNKTDEAVNNLNEMWTKYADHSMADEILWLRANTFLKQGKNAEALEDLKTIVTKYSKDILGDDAQYTLGKIYEERLKDKQAAMEAYQKVLTNYPGSIYTADARKRFRALRGDVLN